MYQADSYQQPYNMMENFPYAEAADYSSKQSIIKAFPHLQQINSTRNWDRNIKYDGVIIRSANDDNVHKAIKYGIWSTTSKNRAKLSQLYAHAQIENREVYLFFSVVKSGMFEGVARLVSNYIDESFPYWWDDFSMKFKGYFRIEWVYLKDVNYKYFDGLYNIENDEIVKSKDCDILNSRTTERLLTIFDSKKMKEKWIFNDFPYMDKRELEYTRRLQQQNSPVFQYPQYGYGYPTHNAINAMNIEQNPMNYTANTHNLQQSYSQQSSYNPLEMKQFKIQTPAELGFRMNPISHKYTKK